MRRLHLVLLLVVPTLFTTGCPPRPPRIIIQPPPAFAFTCWESSDGDQVARRLAAELLAAPWLAGFRAARGRDPVLRLLPIYNQSADPVDSSQLVARLEAELLRSRQVQIVGGTPDTRHERVDQARNASDATVKRERQELGSDFLLRGTVQSQDSEEGGRVYRVFLTTLELSSTETNEKVWMKVHELRKAVVAR